MSTAQIRRSVQLAAPAIVFLGLAIVLFWPATVGSKVLSAGDIPYSSPPFASHGALPRNPLQFDQGNVFEPDGLSVRKALRAGRIPVWTDSQSSGRPLLAAQQSAPLFPLTWIGVVFPFWSAQAWIAVLKLALAALGTYLLARALGTRRTSAMLAGIAFGFGTYLIVWLSHPHSNAYATLPWLFLLAERLCRDGRLSDGATLGGVLGLAYLGGQPESSLIVSVATACWIVHRLLAARLPRREFVLRAALASAAGVLGVAIAAVMLIPFGEALHQAYDTSRSSPALPVRAALSVFFPDYWGRPDRMAVALGPVNFTERTLYVGALPMILALSGLFARRPRGAHMFFGGLALASLALVFNNPFATFVRALPVLNVVNVNRVLVVSSFAIAMLAAFGCDRLFDSTAGERRRMLVAAALATLVPALAVVALHPGLLGDLRQSADQLLDRGVEETSDVLALASVLRWLILAAVGIALLVLLARSRLRRSAVIAAAVGLTALDVLAMDWGYNPAISHAQASPPVPPAVAAMRTLTSGGGRVVGIGALEPNTAQRWGLRDVRGHEDPVVTRNQRLWFALGGGFFGATTAVWPLDRRTPELLDVFGVKALLLAPSMLEGSRLALPAPLQTAPVVYSGPGGVVVRNPDALPQAFVAYRWRSSPGLQESLRLMAAGTPRQARDEPVIEAHQTPGLRPHDGAALPATPARIVSQSDTAVSIDVRARAPGRLVLLDTVYPGWHAKVDGRAEPIEAANAAFQSVAVPAGTHQVRFYYQPASVIAGGAISVLAVVLTALGIVLGRVRAGPGKDALPRRGSGVLG